MGPTTYVWSVWCTLLDAVIGDDISMNRYDRASALLALVTILLCREGIHASDEVEINWFHGPYSFAEPRDVVPFEEVTDAGGDNSVSMALADAGMMAARMELKAADSLGDLGPAERHFEKPSRSLEKEAIAAVKKAQRL